MSERELKLASVVLDFIALAEHKTENRPDNWDGSTQGQITATIREGREALACVPNTFHLDSYDSERVRRIIARLYDGTTLTYDARRDLAAQLESILGV